MMPLPLLRVDSNFLCCVHNIPLFSSVRPRVRRPPNHLCHHHYRRRRVGSFLLPPVHSSSSSSPLPAIQLPHGASIRRCVVSVPFLLLPADFPSEIVKPRGAQFEFAAQNERPVAVCILSSFGTRDGRTDGGLPLIKFHIF